MASWGAGTKAHSVCQGHNWAPGGTAGECRAKLRFEENQALSSAHALQTRQVWFIWTARPTSLKYFAYYWTRKRKYCSYFWNINFRCLQQWLRDTVEFNSRYVCKQVNDILQGIGQYKQILYRLRFLPAYQHLEFPSSIFSTQLSFQEWAKSTSRTNWIRMKQKAPETPIQNQARKERKSKEKKK